MRTARSLAALVLGVTVVLPLLLVARWVLRPQVERRPMRWR